MLNLKKLTQNSLWHFSGKIIGMVIGIITIALITRYLGQSGFGQYSTIVAWLQFFGILADGGLYLILLSELGKAKNKQEEKYIVGNFLALRLTLALLVLSLASLTVWLTPYSVIVKLGVMVLVWSTYAILVNQLITAIFQNKMAMHIGSLIEVGGKTLGLIFVIIIIQKQWGLLAIVGSMSLANLLNTALMLLLVNRFVKIRLYFHLTYWQKIIKLTWPLAIAMIFNIFYFKADTLILSWFRPAAEVGIYTAPYRILEVLVALPPIVLGLIMPQLAADWQQNDRQKLQMTIKQGFAIFHILTIPLIVGGILLAKPIMVLIAGSQFASSAAVLKLLIIATAFIFYSQLLNYVIVATHQQKKIIKYVAGVAILALALYLIFIPRFSYLAAAIITIITEGLILLAYYRIVKTNRLSNFFAGKALGKSLTAALVMGIMILALSNLSIILLIPLSVLIYFLTLRIVNIKNEL